MRMRFQGRRNANFLQQQDDSIIFCQSRSPQSLPKKRRPHACLQCLQKNTPPSRQQQPPLPLNPIHKMLLHRKTTLATQPNLSSSLPSLAYTTTGNSNSFTASFVLQNSNPRRTPSTIQPFLNNNQTTLKSKKNPQPKPTSTVDHKSYIKTLPHH